MQIAYVLRNKAKAYDVLMRIFFVSGGFLVVISGYTIICRCVLAPVFYTLTYILKWLCLFVAPILFLFVLCASLYALQNKDTEYPIENNRIGCTDNRHHYWRLLSPPKCGMGEPCSHMELSKRYA